MISNECNGCEYKCSLSHIAICTLGSPCPNQRSTPMTEQEYLQSCNTEQLARFIFWQHFDVYGKTLYELMVNASKGVSRDKQAEVMIGAVVEWLKQPHKGE